ncbi:MAG TPA: SURF1 family protein [Jiangellaceae bacterium]|nr:SURF1 family protein [Jiangellaceae bacterium]
MLRALVSRRWLLRVLAGAVLVVAFVRLGIWQLDRNEQRAERNAVIEANSQRDPVPVEDLLTSNSAVDVDRLWTPVRAKGRYDVDHQLIIRLRPLDGRPGVHVLTPLVTESGAALLVDRGFVAHAGSPTSSPAIPEPMPGEVEIIGRVRASEEGRGIGGDPATGVIRYVDVDEIAATLPYPVYGAWVEVMDEQPRPAVAPVRPPAPTLDAGPHLSYAVQWFLFACIGIGGLILLARAEARLRSLDEQATANRERQAAGSGS